jgi:hypothetical protein
MTSAARASVSGVAVICGGLASSPGTLPAPHAACVSSYFLLGPFPLVFRCARGAEREEERERGWLWIWIRSSAACGVFKSTGQHARCTRALAHTRARAARPAALVWW